MPNLKQTITKAAWLTAQQCLGMAWHGLHTGYEAPTEAELFRMKQGQEIGRLARELYPRGTWVLSSNGKGPAEITRDLLADASVEVLFEAAVQAGPFVAKADILARNGSGWHVLEVKSSFSDTKKVPDLIDDLAYTVMVFRRAGLPVDKASLVLLSRDYRYGDATDRLFDTIDWTDDVNKRVSEFETEADSVAGVLFDETQPVPALVSACRDCASYKGECLGAGFAHTVLELPRLHYSKLQHLSRDGIVDVLQVPDNLNITS